MPNYRLDVLGFLNVRSIKGNGGLWDSVVALEWLYNNCESLGCNKSEITLFGHSAGSSDTQLLTLSSYAKKYINRAIMQSGSGLAHWAFVYETHLLQKIKSYAKQNNLGLNKMKNLIELVNYDKTKYINSLNDTFNNFIVYSTCNLTKKYACIKEKINLFFNFSSKLNSDKNSKLIEKLNLLFNSLDLNEIISVFGYMHDNLLQKKNQSELRHVFKSHLDILDSFESSNTSSPQYESLISRNNYGKVFKSTDDYSKFQGNPCYADLMHFIWGSENLLIACDFATSYNQYMLDHNVLTYFLQCFQIYYVDISLKLNVRFKNINFKE